ncbi:potassium transporter Kup [Orrella daihaiensis]|uniref:Probable potassium transport system protein Kup n=1 Tax=Orrella daihaiensis TaxID=2782176 RepID=A0ABY4APA0_9BURK|nr:KUP/HAK/KT family potassium transporter [Orrella daihaiensis]UOD49879.1 KUP/HAK/KT family potassium transporter [Orrella daihaiensis]
MKTTQKPAALGLVLGALGVVFGDIGTSPLYAFEAVFSDALHPVSVTPENIYGVLSLFVWSLIIIVTLKYVFFIMRFDNDGEGGIVALMTLLLGKATRTSALRRWFLPLGLIGAALFYGDGIITPAISVVSAVEGLETISPQLSPYVVPVSLVILSALFLFQRQGTERIAKLFGPTMLIWFVVLALLGIKAIAGNPEILRAINPIYALEFIQTQALLSFFVLGAVVLCLTGAEALYADMGHFGAHPIRRAWIRIAFPALLLNYLGQGALVLQSPDHIHNTFFRMAPDWALHGLVVLATLATIVASQAVISGVYSMTQQLIQLRVVPRMRIVHTSTQNSGQIYMPAVNWMMLGLVITLVLYFQSSNAMGAAYGIAVTGTMLITDFFAIAAVIKLKRWHWGIALLGALPFMVIDGLFFSANALKFIDGGWFPVGFSVLILLIMTTWMRGVQAILSHEQRHSQLLAEFVQKLQTIQPYRSKGTAVCLTSDDQVAPMALVLMGERLHAVPEKVICLHVVIEEVPRVTPSHRQTLKDMGQGIYLLILKYGYGDQINLPAQLEHLFPQDDPTNRYGYLINRWSVDFEPGGWALWRKKLFALLLRNATPQSRMFEMPPDRVIEMGSRLIL